MNGYSLDTNAAKQANAGGRIEQNGRYIVKIARAEFVKAKSGSDGMEFECKTSTGDSVQFTLWTRSGSTGETLAGYDKLMALMTCAGVRTLTPTQGMVKKYDYDAKGVIDKSAMIAPEITGKVVGLLLERENYYNSNGDARHQMNLFAAFNAENSMTADEIIDKKTTGANLAKLEQRLAARPEQWRKESGAARPASQARQPAQSAQNSSHSNDLDDDLPF